MRVEVNSYVHHCASRDLADPRLAHQQHDLPLTFPRPPKR